MPAKSRTKLTRSIVLDRKLLALGQSAAKAEGRSFSNWINEVLRNRLIVPTATPATSGVAS